MKKNKKIIYSIIIVVIGYLVFSISFVLLNGHKSEFFNHKRYLWLFNDSLKNDVDTFFCVGDVRESDVLYHYKLKNIFVQIWEFKNASVFDLKNTTFNQNISLDEIKFNWGEILNKNVVNAPEISVKFELPFEDFLNINLNENSTIIKKIESKSYIGFYGTVNKMSFSNKEDNHFILFNFVDRVEPVLFLLYKGHNGFYAIMINSKDPFDEKIIRILNL